MLRQVVLMILLIATVYVKAQDLVVYGDVKQDVSEAPLAGARISLQCKGVEVGVVYTDSSGHYELRFAPRLKYALHFEAEGHVGKWIVIDTRDVNVEENMEGFGMNIDMRLFEPRPGVDYAFLKEPMGIATYKEEDENMHWDMEHTARMRSLLTRAHGGANDN